MTVEQAAVPEWVAQGKPQALVGDRQHAPHYRLDARGTTEKWTFAPDDVRRFVEAFCVGRVLNCYAGETVLDHDPEVRVDVDEDRPADYYFDALYIHDHFAPSSFDVVLLDPPYSDRKAREKYDGEDEVRGKFTVVKDRVTPLVKPGGLVVHFGYQRPGMGPGRGFESVATADVVHGGDINTTLVTVERRAESKFSDYGSGGGGA